MKKVLQIIVATLILFPFYLFRFSPNVMALPDGSSWAEAGTNALPIPLSSTAATVFDNKIWVVGGQTTTGTVINKVFYSSDGFNWAEAGTNTFPVSMQITTATSYNGKLWATGMLVDPFAVNHKIFSSTNGTTWVEAGTNSLVNAPLGPTTILVFNDRLYKIGGLNDSFTLIRKVNYSTDGINWSEAGTNALPDIGSISTDLVYNNKMWVIGGRNNAMDPLRKVYSSTDGITWTEAGTNALPTTIMSGTGQVFDNKMWIMGGVTDGGGTVRSRKVYSSTDGITWTEAGTNALPVATSDLTSVVFDNKMWVIGGSITGSVQTAKVFYTTETDPPSLSGFSPSSGSTINSAVPMINFTTDEFATCRISLTDKSYDNMVSDPTCGGARTNYQSCIPPNLGSAGPKEVYIACADNYGNKDTAATNRGLTYNLVFNFSASSPTECQDTKPSNAPKISRIERSDSSAQVFYTPAGNPVSKYFIAYGEKPTNLVYGVEYEQKSSTSTLSYTVSKLNAGKTYYFKIRGGNGCMPGDWSSVTTSSPDSSVSSSLETPAANPVQLKVSPTASPISVSNELPLPTPTAVSQTSQNFFQKLLQWFLGLFK